MSDKKTFYGVQLECLDGICVFETRDEAEEFRQSEINGSTERYKDDISDVFEVEMTQEEFDNRIEV